MSSGAWNVFHNYVAENELRDEVKINLGICVTRLRSQPDLVSGNLVGFQGLPDFNFILYRQRR